MNGLSLFLDPCFQFSIGLLDENNNWKCWEVHPHSSALFSTVQAMLARERIELEQISEVFFALGPGSYTGIRLGEIMAQTFMWAGVNVHSFLYFQVPLLLGFKEGIWLSDAFKGQLFIQGWENGSLLHPILIEKRNAEQYVEELRKKERSFFSFTRNFSFLPAEMILGTVDFIKEKPQQLFPLLRKETKFQPPFYYRKEEMEFPC